MPERFFCASMGSGWAPPGRPPHDQADHDGMDMTNQPSLPEGRGTPPPEVDEFCAQIKEVLGARAVYFPAAGPPEGEDAPACLARCLAGGDAAFAGEVCECGGRAWEAIIPDLPAACRRILFCGLPVHTSDRLLAFCRQSLARWGENLALHRQAARDHQLWNRFAGQTHFNQLAEEVFAALGERLAVREAAFLVEDDEGRLVPAAGHRIRWSPSQAAALRLSSHRATASVSPILGHFSPPSRAIPWPSGGCASI